MRSFIHRKNLENYRRQLAESKDEAQLAQLRRLLAEEEAKDAPPRKRDDDHPALRSRTEHQE
jgi:hypothetical protein